MGNELSGANRDDEGSRKYDELSAAVDRGDLDAVRRLVEVDGLDPNGDPDSGGWDHPLLRCADRRVARYLHSRGARGYGPDAAARANDLDRIQELAGDIDAARACALIGRCAGPEVARWLFDRAGADSDREGAYHVVKACGLGDLARIRRLAAAPGFDVDRGWLKPMPGCGEELVPYTTEDARAELNERLVKKYRRVSSAKCTQLIYPLQAACFHQNPFRPEVAAYLIDELGADKEILFEAASLDKEWLTPMAMAVRRGRMDLVTFLAEKGAKAPWECGKEAAAKCLLDAAADGGAEMLRFLLGDEERARRFDLTCEDKFGRTPLNLACTLGREANVEFLLSRGEVGVSPNDISAACRDCNVAILRLLLDHGGTLPPDNGVVTMINFEEDGRALEVLQLLQNHGADLAAPHVARGDDGEAYKLFALHDATMHGARSCVEFLLSNGADPDAAGGCPCHPGPGLADDWEGNLDLKYGNAYGDGVCLIPGRVAPVKALFERARATRRGDGGAAAAPRKAAQGGKKGSKRRRKARKGTSKR